MRIFSWLLGIFLLIPFIVAQNIEFFDESYFVGEIVQLKIEINIDLVKDIEPSQAYIASLDNNLIPVQINIIKINNSFYLGYFNIPLGLQSGEYRFLIRGVTYRDIGILKTRDFEGYFKISEKYHELITIFPGVITFFQGDSTYKAVRTSNFEDGVIQINLISNNIVIPSINLLQIPGKSSKTFYLRIIKDNIKESGLYFYNLNENYRIPMYLAGKKVSQCIPQWQCSIWTDCLNRIQTRNCIDVNNCGSGYDKPLLEQVCIEDCTPQWQCKEWSNCINGKESRNCINGCGNTRNETRDCGIICKENWQCSDFGDCVNGIRKRPCVDVNNCRTLFNKPLEEEKCEEICIPNWICSNWTGCDFITSKQNRDCLDINNCNVNCSSEECTKTKECEIKLIKNESAQLNKKIVFFTDKDNQDVQVNSLINENVPEDKELKGFLYIKNDGDVDLKNIKFSLSGNLDEIVKINVTKIDILKLGQIVEQFIWINEDKNAKSNNYEGSMLIEAEDFRLEFPIILKISKNKNEIIEEEKLFIEERSEKVDLDKIRKIEPETKIKEHIRIVLPYKVIAFILLVLLVIIIYFGLKKPYKKKAEFEEFVSKMDKK